MRGRGMKMNTISTSRNIAISVLRIAATVAVVFSHACSTITENPEVATLTKQQFATLDYLLNICKWHVPMFFMLTGMLLLNKKELTISTVVSKYAKRMLLALFVFGVPYAVLIQFFEVRGLSIQMLGKAVIMTLNNESFSHLWYLFAMIGIYLALPVLKLIADKASKELIRYYLIILFALNFVVPFLKVLGFQTAFTMPLGTYVVFYILLGFYLSQINFEGMRHLTMLGVCGIITASLIALTFLLLNGSAAAAMSYQSPVNVLATVSVYILTVGCVSGRCGDKLWKIDRLCFGVYLIHPLFIQFTYKFLKVTPVRFGAWLPMIFVFGAAFVVAGFLSSWLMSLIKPIKKYIL